MGERAARRSGYVDVVRCTCTVVTGGHLSPNPTCPYHTGKAAHQTRMVDPRFNDYGWRIDGTG